jgi:hypothetical protein
MNTPTQARYHTAAQPRLAALALAAVVTLAMLGGVNVLATTDAEAPQMAQAAAQQA